MKGISILFFVYFLVIYSADAQKCAIQIEILEDKFMFGEAATSDNASSPKNIEVNFTSEFMEVIMTFDDQTYEIKVINEACQAYCTKAKRVRQLHSGDEKLVKNLFRDKREVILQQIRACNL